MLCAFFSGLSLIGLGEVGAWSNPGCTPVQILVFSSLIVAVDPVAVCRNDASVSFFATFRKAL